MPTGTIPSLPPKEALILELLVDEAELYGLQLVAASKGRLKRGTVYVTLGRMEEKGYITSTLDAAPSGTGAPPPPPPPGGAPSGTGGLPRRIYAVTTLGQRMFVAWTSGAKQLIPELGR